MSNPVVRVSNNIPNPSDPDIVRTSWTRIIYESQRFYMYSDGETFSDFDPTSKGDRFFMTVSFEEVLGYLGYGYIPTIISDDAWTALSPSPSVFVNAVKSVMPKPIVPSRILCENGLNTGSGQSGKNWAWWQNSSGSSTKEDLFNWEIVKVNGGSVGASSDANKYAKQGNYSGIAYLSVDFKDDKRAENTIEMKLEEPASPPNPQSNDLMDEKYVGGGAFVLVLNVIPQRPGASDSWDASQKGWDFTIEAGEIEMKLVDAGQMAVRINNQDSSENNNWVTVNLMEGRSKGGPPQQERVQGKSPYIIMVYPVWNGIVVASGVQDSRTSAFEIVTTQAASVYVPRQKKASVYTEPWSTGFNPSEPADINVYSANSEAGSTISDPSENTVVDFGESVNVTAKNCKFDIAYLPCYFSPWGAFDEWFLASLSIPGNLEIEYQVYYIWASNATTYQLGTPEISDSGISPEEPPDTTYNYILWDQVEETGGYFARRTSELFGSIIEITETRTASVLNSNGNFELDWSGGIPGDKNSTGDWRDYIQSVSVTITAEGSSGNITVDKYGVAGQNAVPIQSVGAVVLSMNTVPSGCVSGDIFYGIGYGIGDSRSAQGATWTVPLIGLERKLDDILLVYAPFFDGRRLGEAISFLCSYAGLFANTAAADTFTELSYSLDPNVARFDWSAGTSVRTALDDVMQDTRHTYVVRDGAIYFYKLSDYGLPIATGTDWGGSYPNTKIVADEQTPDFEDLRNTAVAMAQQAVYQGEGSKIEDPPSVLRIETRRNSTTPNIPWERSIVQPMPGFIQETEQIEDFADNLAAMSSHYITIGRTSIPGNANIKVYDKWNGFIIMSVSHNVDLVGKTFTTDLELATG